MNAPPQLREVLGAVGRDVVALQNSFDQRTDASAWTITSVRLTVRAGAALVFRVGLGLSLPAERP
jgi:hypothetical protein